MCFYRNRYWLHNACEENFVLSVCILLRFFSLFHRSNKMSFRIVVNWMTTQQFPHGRDFVLFLLFIFHKKKCSQKIVLNIEYHFLVLFVFQPYLHTRILFFFFICFFSLPSFLFFKISVWLLIKMQIFWKFGCFFCWQRDEGGLALIFVLITKSCLAN